MLDKELVWVRLLYAGNFCLTALCQRQSAVGARDWERNTRSVYSLFELLKQFKSRRDCELFIIRNSPRDAHRRACAPLSIGNFIGRYLKRKPLHHASRGPPPLVAALKGRQGPAALSYCDKHNAFAKK